jgi:antitoxin FitA
MADLLIRGLDEETVKRLRARARRHGRTLQGEAKFVLQRAAGAGPHDIAAMLGNWEQRFNERRFTSSADLIREDRER